MIFFSKMMLKLMSFGLLASAVYADSQFMTGRIRALIGDNFNEDGMSSQTHLYFEQQGSGNILPLNIDMAKLIGTQQMKSGSVVKVKGSIDDGALKADEVQHLYHDEEGLSLTIPTTGIKALVLNPDFSACGAPAPVFNETALRRVLFERDNPSANTLGMNMRSCSKGKLTIDSANSRIISFKINATNCTTANYRWNSCPSNFWGYAFTMWMLSGIGADWNSYSSHWFMLPASMRCSFGGLGAVWGDFIWIPNQAGRGDSVRIWAHELGHNLGMNHAATRAANGAVSEYGDNTGIMGSNGACFNLANREDVGWERPAITVNATSLPLGRWTSYNITTSDSNIFANVGLKINTLYRSNVFGKNASVYVEFRRSGRAWYDFVRNQTVPFGGDRQLPSIRQGANMYVYPNPITVMSGLAPYWTLYVGNAAGVSGSIVSELNYTGIHVRVNNNVTSTTQFLQISVCRCLVNQTATACCSNNPPTTKTTPAGVIAGASVAAGVGAAAVGILLYKKRKAGITAMATRSHAADPNTVQL